MSAPELVRVQIDEREVHVPKGTGLIETALAAGVEIPVFCYEPRLGEPIGACRMCLVEVEGMPKLQAGCTLTAQPDMVVKTARTSEKSAEGQNATLEFILVNHPLDCPVCDKGGECPLQDLTFRYGPGTTRMVFPKRTLEKPIPISPTISIDRERCILCYRCTRFTFPSRVVTAMLQPTGQSPHTVGAFWISQGRASKRYCVEVSAPTGQSSTTFPEKAERYGSSSKVAISVRAPRFRAMSRPSSATSSEKRVHR